MGRQIRVPLPCCGRELLNGNTAYNHFTMIIIIVVYMCSGRPLISFRLLARKAESGQVCTRQERCKMLQTASEVRETALWWAMNYWGRAMHGPWQAGDGLKTRMCGCPCVGPEASRLDGRTTSLIHMSTRLKRRREGDGSGGWSGIFPASLCSGHSGSRRLGPGSARGKTCATTKREGIRARKKRQQR